MVNPALGPEFARRGVPAQVAASLERLRQSLARLIEPPLPAEEEARAARATALAEALSTLDQDAPGPIAYSFLMNVDLAASPEFPAETGENETLATLPEKTFLALVPIFIGDASGSDRCYSGVLPPERFSRLTGKIAFRLARSARAESRALLARLFDAGLVSMDQLPADVQEWVVATRLAEGFLAQKDSYLAALDQPVDIESYRLRARPSARVVPVLIERGRYEAAAELVAAFAAHAQERGDRAEAAAEAMGTMVETGVLEAGRQAFLDAGDEEERAVLGRLLALFGARAVSHLVHVVREADDPRTRRQAAEILLASGGEATAGLIELLEEPGLGTAAAVTVIGALGAIEDADLTPLAAESVTRRAIDPEPPVRRAALRSACLLSPGGRFDTFFAALGDSDPGARREAVRGLGLSGDERAPGLLRGMIESAERAGKGEGWDEAAAAIDALGHAGRALPQRRDEISRFLEAFSQRACPSGFLKKLARRPPPLLVLLALAHAAHRLGDARSREVLARLAKNPDPGVAGKAADFLSRRD